MSVDEELRAFQPRIASPEDFDKVLAFLRERLLQEAVDEGTPNVVDRKVTRRRDREVARLESQLIEYVVRIKREQIEKSARRKAQAVVTEARLRDLNAKRAAMEAAIRALVGEEKRRRPQRKEQG